MHRNYSCLVSYSFWFLVKLFIVTEIIGMNENCKQLKQLQLLACYVCNLFLAFVKDVRSCCNLRSLNDLWQLMFGLRGPANLFFLVVEQSSIRGSLVLISQYFYKLCFKAHGIFNSQLFVLHRAGRAASIFKAQFSRLRS